MPDLPFSQEKFSTSFLLLNLDGKHVGSKQVSLNNSLLFNCST